MGMKYRQVGGQASGVGKSYSDMLQGLLTGSYGGAGAASQFGNANPMGGTTGVAGVLNDMLAGGAGKIGGSIQAMIGQQETSDVNALRARYGAGGGAAFGTPAAYAESTYRSQVAPQLTSAIGQLQLSALEQIMPGLSDIYNKTTPQAQVIGQQNPWVQGIGLATNLIGAINPFGSHSGTSVGNDVPLTASSAPNNPWINSQAQAPGAGTSFTPSWSMPQYQMPMLGGG